MAPTQTAKQPTEKWYMDYVGQRLAERLNEVCTVLPRARGFDGMLGSAPRWLMVGQVFAEAPLGLFAGH